MNYQRLLHYLATLYVCNVVFVSASASDGCQIKPMDREVVQYLRDYSVMHIFEVEIYKSSDPLRTDVSRTYKPWKWYRMTSDHGKTLLTLSFNFDVLSLSILTIGVEKVPLRIKDIPEGCFGTLTAEERVDIIRDNVFDNFKSKRQKKTVPVGEEELQADETELPEIIYVCNNIVREIDGYSEFANRCCARDSEGRVTCSEHEDNLWITVLYICIFLVKLMMMMCAPLLIPSYMYTASYVASEYVVKLTKELKMKVFVSESKTTSIRYKHRLTLEDISDWRCFKECAENLPVDQICNVKVPELRIKVKGKRIIPANEPPSGLLRTIYDNLIRCKIRSVHPFKDCCNSSIYASLQPLIGHKCNWEDLVLTFIKALVLFLVPAPLYLRIFIYYRFELEELDQRRDLIKNLGLKESFNPYRMNIVQYLTPTHWIFLGSYAIYILTGVVIGFSEDYIKDKLKSIVRSAFHDMQNVSRTNVLQIVIGFLLWPFQKIGLLALLTCPIISAITAPLWFSVFILYSVPTIYLAYRLVFHSRKKLGNADNSLFESDKPFGKAKTKVYKVHKKLVKMDKNVHIKEKAISDEEKYSPCISGNDRLSVLRRTCVQVIISIFCLIVLFSSVLLFVEACGMIVEVLVFTMMGIIVNAGATLRYVSMVLLVIVYMHSCYNNVYDNYLQFNGTIIDDVMERVEDLNKVASLPSNLQENVAFQLKPVEAVDEIPTSLNLNKKEPHWRIGRLLLFFDSYDTPRIPLNLFKKLCEVRVHGAPGPVYINLLKATGKFSIIVVFLFFVMIVVMAFGSANQMSSTNQTLATLAGGFVPMLLKNVLSSKGAKLNLKTLSFKGQIDEIVSEYKQNWPIFDLIVEQYDPKEEADMEEQNEENKETDEKKTNEDMHKKYDEDIELEKPKGVDLEKMKTDQCEQVSAAVSQSAMGTTLMPLNVFNDTCSVDKWSSDGATYEDSPDYMRRLSTWPQDDNFVDLFIDLSTDETLSPWQWMHGSTSDSTTQSMTMLNEIQITDGDTRMPYNQTSGVHNNT